MRFNGCHNREPFKTEMVVQDGWIYGGDVRMAKTKTSPCRMAPDCQYTLTELGKADPQCTDCKWKHKEEKQ